MPRCLNARRPALECRGRAARGGGAGAARGRGGTDPGPSRHRRAGPQRAARQARRQPCPRGPQPAGRAAQRRFHPAPVQRGRQGPRRDPRSDRARAALDRPGRRHHAHHLSARSRPGHVHRCRPRRSAPPDQPRGDPPAGGARLACRGVSARRGRCGCAPADPPQPAAQRLQSLDGRRHDRLFGRAGPSGRAGAEHSFVVTDSGPGMPDSALAFLVDGARLAPMVD